MRKSTLSLDKELLTSGNGASTVDGGTAPTAVLLLDTIFEALSVFTETCTQACDEPKIVVED